MCIRDRVKALSSGMDALWQKQQVISHNIANVETPGYKAKHCLLYTSINNKAYEAAWMVTLQLGSSLIPPSIFDFMK